MGKIYRLTFEEWSSYVSRYWPKELITREAKVSVVPRLIETQDKFLSILILSDKNPLAWEKILAHTSLGGNLFLKHLMVLADVGSELLQRLSANFPYEERMEFKWKGELSSYEFEILGKTKTRCSNKALGVHDLSQGHPLTPLQKDVAMLLLYGGFATYIPEHFEWSEDKCIIGDLLGDSHRIEDFVRKRYIVVSRITQGSTANKLGQLFQDYVYDHLRKELGDGWSFEKNGTIPGIRESNQGREMCFDIVARKLPDGPYCGIEVSFQVTTNSTIERKAGLAEQRYNIMRESWLVMVSGGESKNFANRHILILLYVFSPLLNSLRT